MSAERVDLATCDEDDFPDGGIRCTFDFEPDDEYPWDSA